VASCILFMAGQGALETHQHAFYGVTRLDRLIRDFSGLFLGCRQLTWNRKSDCRASACHFNLERRRVASLS
jgi:hypothetical protein